METFDVKMDGTFAAPPKGQPMPGQAARVRLPMPVKKSGFGKILLLAGLGVAGFAAFKFMRKK